MTEYIDKQSLLSELAKYQDCGAAYREVMRIVSMMSEVKEQEAEPLTLDELMDMCGEPVYCVDSKGNGKWAFVENHDEVCIDSDYEDWEFYCYGWDNDDGWRAYRNKPKEARQ